MKIVAAALILLSTEAATTAADRFNCPEPAGEITIDDDIWKAWPTHTDKWLPTPLDVDYVCSVNADGRFVSCQFAPRSELDKGQASRLNDIMIRMMRYMKSDTPNQPCVASKIRLQTSDVEAS